MIDDGFVEVDEETKELKIDVSMSEAEHRQIVGDDVEALIVVDEAKENTKIAKWNEEVVAKPTEAKVA